MVLKKEPYAAAHTLSKPTPEQACWTRLCEAYPELYARDSSLGEGIIHEYARPKLSDAEKRRIKERIELLAGMIENLTHTQSRGYTLALTGDKLERAQRLQAQIETLQKTLTHGSVQPHP